jgi:hypothetical protein
MARPTGCLASIGALALLLGFGSCVYSLSTSPTVTTQPTPPPAPPAPPPPGWKVSEHEGIFWRWCTNDPACSSDRVIGDGSYVLMQVWCKDRPCGDIYAQVNLINAQDVVVGWTNDSGYGDIGQKVQLTFHATQDDWETARLTQLSVTP